jgi:serine/threonine-protein kinase ATR
MYRFLAKPEDDLRKDSRVMEVNSLVNKLLSRDIEARRRQLRIETFAVIPVDEKNGLIEWVNNLIPYRTAVYQFSPKARGLKLSYDKLKNKPAAVRYNQIMADFDLCFYQWFAVQFPEPMSWLDARQCYTRSAAVMSIVGTIIGLGDRHGENILLNSKTGMVVHVDFNAIFNKGEGFQVPERVPFRLTRNMVDAMGLTGVEGGFRRVCEIVLKVLRHNRDMVLSVLETFLYDPLVEFKSHKDPSNKTATKRARSTSRTVKSVNDPSTEPVNEKAREIIDMIERRLVGKIDAKPWEKNSQSTNPVFRAVALSVEGHVEHLIQQATDPGNLGAMYVGWSSWV